jgi:hypothetical protein
MREKGLGTSREKEDPSAALIELKGKMVWGKLLADSIHVVTNGVPGSLGNPMLY